MVGGPHHQAVHALGQSVFAREVAKTMPFSRAELWEWCSFCFRHRNSLRVDGKQIKAFEMYHFWTAFMVQCTLGLRVGELVHPTRRSNGKYGIRMRDVRFIFIVENKKYLLDSNAQCDAVCKDNLFGARIVLQNSKTRKMNVDAEVWLGRSYGLVDPVVHLWKIHRRNHQMARQFPGSFRARPTDHVFQRDGGPLCVDGYRRRFHKCVAYLKLRNPEFRVPHSARKTFFTMLSRCGIEKQEICSAGRWVLPDAASVYRVWNESDGLKFAKIFWTADLQYDDCIFEYPGDVPKDIKAIVAPWAKGKKKHISAVIAGMGEE